MNCLLYYDATISKKLFIFASPSLQRLRRKSERQLNSLLPTQKHSSNIQPWSKYTYYLSFFLVEKRFLVYLVLENNGELRWHHASFRRTTLSCLPFVHSSIFPFQILIIDKVSPDKNMFQTSSQGSSTTSSSGSGSPMDVPAGSTTKQTATNNAMVVN